MWERGLCGRYIMWERGLEASPIMISELLNSPSAKKVIDAGPHRAPPLCALAESPCTTCVVQVIDAGGLVSDLEVFGMLLDALAQPEQRAGALVDGFPRTVVQVCEGQRGGSRPSR